MLKCYGFFEKLSGKMLSAAQQGDLNLNQYTTEERTNYVNSLRNNFPGIYDYFRKYKGNWDHQQMADYYRSTIAKGLKQFDNGQQSDEFYNDMAWEGLANIVDANGEKEELYTKAWGKLSKSEQDRIKDAIADEKVNGNKNCQ